MGPAGRHFLFDISKKHLFDWDYVAAHKAMLLYHPEE
jgi:hypothetical protein